MEHKFEDYDKKEQREIIFEIIRQKYLKSPDMNGFSKKCNYMIKILKDFESGNITETSTKQKIVYFYDYFSQEIANEVLFYFYHIAEGVVEDSTGEKSERYGKICDIISNIINIDDLKKRIIVPEDKLSSTDNSHSGFSLQSYSRFPAPNSYVAPPKPPKLHKFTNPYINKDFKSICDYVRYKMFDLFHDTDDIENFEDLNDVISVVDLVPDGDDFINFPQVDYDGEMEDLDFENPGDFIINDENSITFGGGGDWQEPKTFSFKLEKNGKVKAFNITDDSDDNNWTSNPEMILKVICKLFGLNINNYNPDSVNPDDLKRLYDDMVANKDYKLTEPENITTEDCVNAICKYFRKNVNYLPDMVDKKNWKRLSKKGTHICIRVFENRVTMSQVKVTSTKIEIIKVETITK